jgi:hypothetical protein
LLLQGGVLHKDLSKLLSKNFPKATLPKFISGEAHEWNLEHISVGKKVPSFQEREKLKYAEHDSLPFAVIPSEHMRFHQLRDALSNHGLNMPHPASIINLRTKFTEAGFTIEEEAAIEKSKHAKHLSSTVLPKLQKADRDLQTKVDIVKKNSSDKLYPELSKPKLVSAMKQYGAVPST